MTPMADKMKCLGSTKISSKLRMSLLKDVAEKMGVTDGDVILFYEDEKGQIVIRKG
jgi:bifunctional DNA-binding transcriptional regulator/antitoxin component of YhaV-PrlF toxin-antitoxin module